MRPTDPIRILAASLLTASLLFAPAVSRGTGAPEAPLVSLGEAEARARAVRLDVTVAPGAREVALLRDGVETTRASVPDPDSGGTLAIRVHVAADVETYTAIAYGEGGEAGPASEPFVASAADFRPRTPGLAVASGTVARRVVAAGTCDTRTVSIIVDAGGMYLMQRRVEPSGAAAFDLPSAKIPYGGIAVRVRARNAWGDTPSEEVVVWNLGTTPGAARYVLVDKSDMMLYLVEHARLVASFPVAIGMPGTPTRVGTWYIRTKERLHGGSAYGVLRMSMWSRRPGGWHFSGYYIHGTNRPSSIGTMASMGCVRMYNPDVLRLSTLVPLGTLVRTRE
ncbi:MAG: L,D-transpeptidase [Coriobacteriia bacterium]